jgi:diguanylate cyclase (GGDEF)-like protein/PAS domain S-box-containing protein
VGAAVLIYVLGWILLHRALSLGVELLISVPVVTIALLFGFWPGLCAGLLGFLSNALLWFMFQDSIDASFLFNPFRITFGIVLVCGGGIIGYIRDLYHRLAEERGYSGATQDRLRESEERFRLLAEFAPYPISILDSAGRYLFLNRKFTQIFGYTLEDIPTGKDWFENAFPKHEYRRMARDFWLADMKEAEDYEIKAREFTVMCKGGIVRDIIFQPMKLKGGNQFIVYEDITEKKETDERLRFSALYDALTGLANRELLKDHLQRSIIHAKRRERYIFAVLFVDLDGFKFVNDSFGHKVGDELLCYVANKLRVVTRPTDTIARVGADEFVILLYDIRDLLDAIVVAERVIDRFKIPFRTEELEIPVSLSIGIAPYHEEYEKVEELLRDADIALHRAKANGKSRYEIFDVGMRESMTKRLAIESQLRVALKKEHFSVNYQPIWSLSKDQPVGFEALIRWMESGKTISSPGEFIPIAEETGLIVPIDYWLIRNVCEQVYRWQVEYPATRALSFNLNLSSRDFVSTPDLVDVVSDILQSSELKAKNLHFELTESAIMQNIDAVVGKINKLREMGIRFDLDDFGTGYSSLSYLHNFPVDGLKIDRTFTNNMLHNGRSLSIVRSIITIARDLGLEVVSEGVETQEQLDLLRELGCEFVQGYLYSKPLDADSTERMLADLKL